MDTLTILTCVIVLIPTLIFLYFKKSFSYFRSNKIPHSAPAFPYGNVKGIGRTIHLGQIFRNCYEQFKSVDKICGIYIFSQPVHVLCDLDVIKDVLVKDFNKFQDRGFYHNEKDDPLSGHLVALSGERWKKVRTQMTPTFTSGKMKFMYPTIVEVTNRFKDYLQNSIKINDEIEMKDILARYTMDVIGTVAFGIECNSLKDPNSEFRQMSRSALEKPRHNPAFVSLMNTMPAVARFLRLKQIRDDVSEFFLGVVHDTIRYREMERIERSDFMDLMIKLKRDETSANTNGLTMNEIAAQAFVFFIAGFETSSLTMVFTLYELALNMDIQTKARSEIENTLNKHDGQFSYEAMMDMPYIDQIINETLRKYPAFPVLRRVANEDYKVRGTSYTIKKGYPITVPIYGIHHDPEYFPDPEKYDPHRFSTGEMNKRNNMAWLAFGEGPRNCIGSRFAMMQTRIGLITLLRNFEFSVCSKTTQSIEFSPSSVILIPKDGIYLKLKPLF